MYVIIYLHMRIEIRTINHVCINDMAYFKYVNRSVSTRNSYNVVQLNSHTTLDGIT